MKKAQSTKKSKPWLWFGIHLTSIFCLLTALGSYNPTDPSWHTFKQQWAEPKNGLGYIGSWSSDFLFQNLGYAAWIIPLLMGVALFKWFKRKNWFEEKVFRGRFYVALFSVLMASTLILHMTKALQSTDASFPAQGILGLALHSFIGPFFGKVGSWALVTGLILIFLKIMELSLWSPKIGEALKNSFQKAINFILTPFRALKGFFSTLKHKASAKKAAATKLSIANKQETTKKVFDEEDIDTIDEEEESYNSNVEPKITQRAIELNDTEELDDEEYLDDEPEDEGLSLQEKLKQNKDKKKQAKKNVSWKCPPIKLLNKATFVGKRQTKDELLASAKKISEALESFDVRGEIVEISPGPIITMFEFQPAPGIRVQKIVNVATELAMALGVPSVRIVAPIPGKSVAGIEVPNPEREDIVLRDVFESTTEKAKKMKLPLMMGKDGEGRPVIEDLSRMPHLLVGGATSMGKSVLVNSILTGLLCRFTPDELKLIIVDPKLVEFKIYEDIPHLLLPIVNDANDASQSLKWAVAETKRRYVEMQKHSAKNLESYNTKMQDMIDKGEVFENGDEPEKFAYIVIIVDELAELMLTGKKDVEQSIVRLTQLARAAGIHMVMATQRPSADVVTGLIKSNCPSRAALRVASANDSRIILDCSGAEVLLGMGDMFFTNSGPMGLKRLQGSFVSDEEVEQVCDFWRDQGEPMYDEQILAPEPPPGMGDEMEKDNLFDSVVLFAREKGAISTSLIQRKFSIGYTRAARIMEQMESAGIVGEQASAGKPREVIV